MTVLITGAGGFIGFHLARALLHRGVTVVGVDRGVATGLKAARLAQLAGFDGFTCAQASVTDPAAMADVVAAHRPAQIIHLAALSNARAGAQSPQDLLSVNVTGHLSVLEASRALGDDVRHVLYASSYAVYGDHGGVACREDMRTDHPTSLYAASKQTAELISTTYAALYGLPQTGLRLFNVYGPWGRPDTAYGTFTARILAGQSIDVFNGGDLTLDFVYIDDVVADILAILDQPPPRHTQRLLNIGSGQPRPIIDMIAALGTVCGRTPILNHLPRHAGDVTACYADTTVQRALGGVRPLMPFAEGLGQYVAWHRAYHNIP